MEVSTLIRKRLEELGLEQKDLADAADVTESYISQLLRQRKLPPAADRTDIYDKLGKFLKLPAGELAKLAEHQRRHEFKKRIEDPPAPLFKEVRELILRKCRADRRNPVRAIFEKQPFGELERLVTQKIVDIVRSLAREESGQEPWLRLVAQISGQSHKQMRAAVLEFLDSDLLSMSAETCLFVVDPLLVSWDIDLVTFGLDVVLNRRLAPVPGRRFEFVEKRTPPPAPEQPGLRAFLKDSRVSGSATEDEIEFLKQLRFKQTRRPTALYYYRELQNLRDPLHFRSS